MWIVKIVLSVIALFIVINTILFCTGAVVKIILTVGLIIGTIFAIRNLIRDRNA